MNGRFVQLKQSSALVGTNWHHEGADLAKSILRMEGSKCGPHHLGLEIDSL